jgi:hypothetical protein
MKTIIRIALLPALAALAAVQACAPSLHSGLQSAEGSDRLGKASTSLVIGSPHGGVEATGEIRLSSGSATVTFTTPSGETKTWEFVHGGSASAETFEVGYQSLAGAGSYGLEIAGSETARGGYDLSLDAYPR